MFAYAEGMYYSSRDASEDSKALSQGSAFLSVKA